MISLQLDDIEIWIRANNITPEYLFQNHILIDNYYLCPLRYAAGEDKTTFSSLKVLA